MDPKPNRWTFLARLVPSMAFHTCSDLPSARQCLSNDPPDLVVTNLRLGPYNGLYLVYLSRDLPNTRVLLYGSLVDLPLILEGQHLGAFFEMPERVVYGVRSFSRGEWPARDRRAPREFDRRRSPRGGRRAADSPASVA